MLERLTKTHRNLSLIVLGALLVWFGWTVRSVLNPLVLGYLLAYILRPMVQRLQDKGFGRRSAVNIIFALFAAAFLVVGGAIFVQGRQFVGNQITLAKKGEDPFTRAEDNINGVLGNTFSFFDDLFRSDVADAQATKPVEPVETDKTEESKKSDAPDPDLTLRSLGKTAFENWFAATGAKGGAGQARVVLGFIQRVFGDVMNLFAFLMLLPVYTYFLLFELERIHEFIRSHVPKRERERVTRIGRRVGSVVANFFRGRLLICFLKGLVMAVGLTILQVPYGVLLGILSGFMSLIPFVGPVVGFGLTMLVAVQQVDPADSGIWLSLGLIGGVFMLAEFIEGYILIPKILGDSLGLHPVVILLSVFVGGAALGLFGFLIAIPLAATLIILFRELVMPALADFAEEDSHTDRAELAKPPEA